MKYAADFRSIARNALSGRWTIAVIAGLIASLLGAVSDGGGGINFKYNNNGADAGVTFGGQEIFNFQTGLDERLAGIIAGSVFAIVVFALVLAAAYFVLSSVVGVGYSRFNLDLVDRQKQPEIGVLCGYFKYWKTTAAANLMQLVYILLWSLLFIIPGIVASYSYAMTNYILAENPELPASEAIERSKQMMYGNRFRLFCLRLSFIGWDLLCALTLGIGNLWLTPYKQAATAAFFREVSGLDYANRSPFTN